MPPFDRALRGRETCSGHPCQYCARSRSGTGGNPEDADPTAEMPERRGIRPHAGVAQCDAGILPGAIERRLFVCPSWRLRSQDPLRGGAHRALVLRGEPYFAAALPDTLCELERAVLIGEREADPARAARQAHPNPGVKPKAARRWLRRRQEMVSRSLMTIVTLLPDLFAGCPPTVGALRVHLATDALLMTLREPCANQLKSLRPPVGFFPHNFAPNRKPTLQHKLGRDPPRLWRSGFLLPGESGGRQGAAPRRRPKKTIYSCRPPGRFGSHRPAANRRRADAAPAPLSVLPRRPPASKYPANLRQLVRQGQPAPCAGACRTDKLPLPAHGSRKRGTRRPPTQPVFFSQEPRFPSAARRLDGEHCARTEGPGKVAGGFSDSESGSFCPNPGAGRFRPRFTLSQSRRLKPRGIQPDESSEETEALWENFLRRGRNNSGNQLRTNAKFNSGSANSFQGGAGQRRSSSDRPRRATAR